MKKLSLPSLCLLGFLVGITLPAFSANAAEPGPGTGMDATTRSDGPGIAQQNYYGLPNLIAMICNEAGAHFKDFYGASVVRVEPFSTLGMARKNRQSEFSALLSDEMTATLHNNLFVNRSVKGDSPQRLRGSLQEIDGYLRIHLTGVNEAQDSFSYIVNVEMSAPVYRALHTYL